MREPYRTLFEGYEEHWFFGRYLTGDEPEWPAMTADDRLPGLSSGEKVLLDVACSFAGPWRHLDRSHRTRIAVALLDMP